MVRLALTLLGVTLVICHSAPAQIAPISVDTPYNHITIERFGSVVEMRSLWRTTIYRESAVDMSDPSHLIVPYTRFIAASAVFGSVPKNVLMIGLGGGGLNQFFEKAFPGASFETVEIDQTVFRLAQEHMAFRISEKNKVTILDGRMFLRRSKTIYDWIILDAFRGGFVPPHLKTVEFYRLAQTHLAPHGIFVANVHDNTALFASDLRTMLAVFPQVGFFDVSLTSNAVIVGANFGSPSLQDILANVQPSRFNEIFRRNDDLPTLRGAFHIVAGGTNEAATILTDDFAPTEFLEAARRNNLRQ